MKAREVEKELLEQASRPRSNVLSAAEIRSLANSVAAQKNKPQVQSLNDVLQKLTTTTSVVVRKITSSQVDPLGGSEQLEDETPPIKMKMEVLDEEVANLPAEDFFHYNDTDDDDPEAVYKHTFQVSVDENGNNSTDESVSARDDNADDDDDYEPSTGSKRVFVSLFNLDPDLFIIAVFFSIRLGIPSLSHTFRNKLSRCAKHRTLKAS